MRISILIIAFLLFCGFSPINQDKFNDHASRFYTQMFVDGYQSEQVTVYYEDMIHIFKKYNDDPLYQELELMYEALGVQGVSAEKHRNNVMNMLNDRH